MKSRAPSKPYTGPERVLYITETSSLPAKTRKSGRVVCQPGPGGILAVGMGESLAKTFTNYEGVAAYAEKNGYKVKVVRTITPAQAAEQEKRALALVEER